MLDDSMKEKLLQKILELFSDLPDKEDLADGGKDEAQEGDLSMDPKAKGLEMMSISAKPLDKDPLKKGLL